MTDNEKAVMTDCYKFLNEFSNPPAGEADEYWGNVSDALTELSSKHKNHPLAIQVGAGILDYLEQKWKAINRRRGKT